MELLFLAHEFNDKVPSLWMPTKQEPAGHPLTLQPSQAWNLPQTQSQIFPRLEVHPETSHLMQLPVV